MLCFLLLGKLTCFSSKNKQMPQPHILVVCTANICRSPVGEVLLQTKLHLAGLVDWTVASAGTWAAKGHAASPFSIALMAERGLDIQIHGSQPVTEALMQQSDLVLCMETDHLKLLQKQFPAYLYKIYTVRQMVNKRGSVRDPYGGSLRQYARMVAELDDLIERGFLQIQALAWENYQKRGTDGAI